MLRGVDESPNGAMVKTPYQGITERLLRILIKELLPLGIVEGVLTMTQMYDRKPAVAGQVPIRC